MTRTFKTLVTVCLGAFLLTSAGCEDKEAQEALKTCKSEVTGLQKSVASQVPTISGLRAQLAQSEAKVQELTKEIDTSKAGKGGKVKSRKQAIAIALHEAGASKNDSKSKNKQNLAKTKRKEAAGKTAQQEAEGKSRVGARSKRESSKAMGGKNARTPAKRKSAR